MAMAPSNGPSSPPPRTFKARVKAVGVCLAWTTAKRARIKETVFMMMIMDALWIYDWLIDWLIDDEDFK
jgi:hypothetical protein